MTTETLNTTIIKCLRPYKPKMIGIFGSYARNTQVKGSDIDILIDLKKKITLLDLVGIELELTRLLGIKVDLVTKGALKNKKLIDNINKDLKVILG
jgi:uncharacterized protein